MCILFLDRDPAFEFKNCLNEYIRYMDRMRRADASAHINDDEVYALYVYYLISCTVIHYTLCVI